MTQDNNDAAVQQTVSMLDNLNLAGLKAVQQALRQKMTLTEQREIANAQQQIQTIARNLGKTVDEIMGTGKFGQPAPVKYRSPDGTQTWSGRGRQPGWVTKWLEEKDGRTLDQLAI